MVSRTAILAMALALSSSVQAKELDDVNKLAAKMGYPVFRRDADDRTTWIVVDCVDVVLHVFEPNTRAHYDLEMLWADAPRVEWERPGQMKRDRAGLG